jgi:hypothetical protein
MMLIDTLDALELQPSIGNDVHIYIYIYICVYIYIYIHIYILI